MSGTVKLTGCPKCGAPIPAEAPQGLCPKCLLAQASAPTETGGPEETQSTPPGREDLSNAFPQLEIVELIGKGGMGFVFKARQPKLERFVALKILPQSLACDPAFAERFAREGRVLARLNHPNIVTVHDFGQANGFFYLLMEFVDGVTLRQAMRAGKFSPAQALTVVPKICEALQFAHEEGVLHRDIKPENILLDSKGRVKIADFGIAKLLAATLEMSPSPVQAEKAAGSSTSMPGEASQSTLTETGRVFGTPHYMAPEQIENPKSVDQRADIYSLGVVFYEMLTGELPLGRFAPPSAKSEVDSRIDEIVLKALEKEREHRQRSASEIKTQVETVSQTPPRRQNGSPSRAPADRFWKRLALSGAAVMLGLILIGLLMRTYRTARAREAAELEWAKLERTRAAAQGSEAQQQSRGAASKESFGTNSPTSPSVLRHVLKRQLAGPDKERAQLKLQFAERQLVDAQKRCEAGTISEFEYDRAKLDRDVARAELNGDGVESARAKLEFAERQVEATKKRYETGTAPVAEYERAQLDRNLAAISLREAQQAGRSGNVPPDLREARAKLAELRVSYGENHPEILAQTKRIEELERMTREEPDAPADLREAKAVLAELRSSYGESHPVFQRQLARVRALEGK